jgi:KTSC domain-containing protein
MATDRDTARNILGRETPKQAAIVRRRINSVIVDSLRYEPSTKELFVTFKDGGRYVYQPVSLIVAQGLVKAASVGEYLQKYVKNRDGCKFTKLS